MVLPLLALGGVGAILLAKISNDDVKWINKPYPSGRHGDSNPADKLKILMKEFGEPDYIDKEKNGFAVWDKKTLEGKNKVWERIEIHDEQIPNGQPYGRVDFLYTWFKLNVPEDKISDIRSLSDSITYDPLKNLIRVRSDCMGTNKSIIYLATLIVKDKTNVKEAKKFFGKIIDATNPKCKNYDKEIDEKLEEELEEYLCEEGYWEEEDEDDEDDKKEDVNLPEYACDCKVMKGPNGENIKMCECEFVPLKEILQEMGLKL